MRAEPHALLNVIVSVVLLVLLAEVIARWSFRCYCGWWWRVNALDGVAVAQAGGNGDDQGEVSDLFETFFSPTDGSEASREYSVEQWSQQPVVCVC